METCSHFFSITERTNHLLPSSNIFCQRTKTTLPGVFEALAALALFQNAIPIYKQQNKLSRGQTTVKSEYIHMYIVLIYILR